MKKIPLYLGIMAAVGAIAVIATIKYRHRQQWKVLISDRIGSNSVHIEAQRSEWIPTPGTCMVRASLTGNGSFPPFEEVFPGGWRLVVESGCLSKKKDAGPGLIELSAERRINGPDIAKQYYQVVGGKLALVRLEDDEGKMIPNRYTAPNQTIGPQVPRRTATEWANALQSSSEGEILAALTWLGGEHAQPSSKPVQYLHHEDLEMARLVEEVYGRVGVRQRIVELTKSTNSWIREAAEWAKDPHYEELMGPGGPPTLPSWR